MLKALSGGRSKSWKGRRAGNRDGHPLQDVTQPRGPGGRVDIGQGLLPPFLDRAVPGQGKVEIALLRWARVIRLDDDRAPLELRTARNR